MSTAVLVIVCCTAAAMLYLRIIPGFGFPWAIVRKASHKQSWCEHHKPHAVTTTSTLQRRMTAASCLSYDTRTTIIPLITAAVCFVLCVATHKRVHAPTNPLRLPSRRENNQQSHVIFALLPQEHRERGKMFCCTTFIFYPRDKTISEVRKHHKQPAAIIRIMCSHETTTASENINSIRLLYFSSASGHVHHTHTAAQQYCCNCFEARH